MKQAVKQLDSLSVQLKLTFCKEEGKGKQLETSVHLLHNSIAILFLLRKPYLIR